MDEQRDKKHRRRDEVWKEVSYRAGLRLEDDQGLIAYTLVASPVRRPMMMPMVRPPRATVKKEAQPNRISPTLTSSPCQL